LFTRIRDWGFALKKEKCRLFQKTVKFLGFEVSKDGIKPLENKLDAIKRMPDPTDVGGVRSFLGAVNFYQRFIPEMSSKAAPLYDLLKKDVEFHWGDKEKSAFNTLKDHLSSDDILIHYDPELPVGISCDASPFGIGAVLFHRLKNGRERPICFASKSLTPAEKGYSQIQREGLGIIYGVKKFHYYLYGRKFILITDHKPLLQIFSPSKEVPAMQANRLQRWSQFLSAYTYDIEYRRTDDHGNADVLSRLPLGPDDEFQKGEGEESVVCTLEREIASGWNAKQGQVKRVTAKDPVFIKVKTYIEGGWPMKCDDPELAPYFRKREELHAERGLLWWARRVVIPKTLRAEILKSLHSGHFGRDKMIGEARRAVWWPEIDEQIKNITKECRACNETGPAQTQLVHFKWPVPQGAWERVHIDYCGPFKGKMWCVVVDAFSKWPEIGMMDNSTSATTIRFLEHVFARQGLPKIVVSDNGTCFTSHEFQSFLAGYSIHQILSSPYHPRSNGCAENMVGAENSQG
jgi:hypothetical protein